MKGTSSPLFITLDCYICLLIRLLGSWCTLAITKSPASEDRSDLCLNAEEFLEKLGSLPTFARSLLFFFLFGKEIFISTRSDSNEFDRWKFRQVQMNKGSANVKKLKKKEKETVVKLSLFIKYCEISVKFDHDLDLTSHSSSLINSSLQNATRRRLGLILPLNTCRIFTSWMWRPSSILLRLSRLRISFERERRNEIRAKEKE